MKLSDHGKRILAYKLEQMVARMITPKEYLIAVKAIYQSEMNDQSWEVQEFGYMARKVN